MVTFFVIWIDRSNAKVFQFSREKMERKTFRSHSIEHHTHRLDQGDIENREKKLFKEVVDSISDESQILILGPGVVKHHLLNHINEHHPLLAKKVVGCETVDHPTDPQIAEIAMKYFKIASTYPSSVR